MCQKQQDLYDFAQEYGVGTFEASFMESTAKFYIDEGDYQESLKPTIDYRKADEIYSQALLNFNELINTLQKLKGTEYTILIKEKFITEQHLQVFCNIYEEFILHYIEEKKKLTDS